MKMRLLLALTALAASGGLAKADPSAVDQAKQAIEKGMNAGHLQFSRNAVDKSNPAVVCGYVTLINPEDQREIERKYLVDTSDSSTMWVEGRTGKDEKSAREADAQFLPKWKSCHQ